MSGIPQWSKNVAVVATTGKRIRTVNLTFSTVLNAGASISVDVLSSPGYIAKVKKMALQLPFIPGATSGSLMITSVIAGYAITEAQLQVPYSDVKGCCYLIGEWTSLAPTIVKPADKLAQFLLQSSLTYDEISPLRFTFYNQTNYTDDGSQKVLTLWVEEEKTS